MAAIPKFDEANLQAFAGIGGYEHGIDWFRDQTLPARERLSPTHAQMTKRHRLYAALAEEQNADGCANNVLGFVRYGSRRR